MLAAITSIREVLLDLVFPVACVNCRREGLYLCIPCQKNLKKNEFQLCAACGKPSPFGATHAACRTDTGLDGLISAVPYKEPLARKLVEYCKYRFISGITDSLAEMMATEIMNLEMQRHFRDFSLVPLPLHPSKKRWRGFNQSELIATRLAYRLDMTMRPDFLVRQVKTKAQAELKDDERVKNVSNAFRATQPTKDRKIIIVDDVSTTRSTLTEACKALKSSGAAEVWGLTFAQG
jgi:competence protein ComFC